MLAALTDECFAILASPSTTPRHRADVVDRLTILQLLAEDVHELLAARHRQRLAACRAVIADLSVATSPSSLVEMVTSPLVAERLGFERLELVYAPESDRPPALNQAPHPAARVPIVINGTTAGHLHAASSVALVVDADRDVLRTLANGFARIYARNELLERLDQQRSLFRESVRRTERTVVEFCDAAIDFDGAVPATNPEGRYGPDGGAALLAGLTPRQREIFDLIALGANNSDIGTELGLAEGTVKSHVKRLLRTLGVINRSQAIVAYHELAGSPGPQDIADGAR
ncbi:helix-turn-helix transcriptional regulator [Patulibacter minatonensis]|uniref:helix-turn-helix transcriptional regulator n=1 Tax=Patulibacter minatonensis TaxID=298163 RepID=UPI00146FB921|nr:helix-turn-helix transcriptional regulator [Patulibacter minatonensis]